MFWTMDCAGQDGRTWRGVRASLGIVREYAAESAFDRSFIIYHKYKPILYAFDTSMSTMSSYGCRTRSV
jgi:hypothetical protein